MQQRITTPVMTKATLHEDILKNKFTTNTLTQAQLHKNGSKRVGDRTARKKLARQCVAHSHVQEFILCMCKCI